MSSSDGNGSVKSSSSAEEEQEQVLKQLAELLDNGENCMSWERLLIRVTPNEFSIILTNINGRLENALKGSEDIEGLILTGGSEMIASRCIQAYIYAVNKQVDEALEVIRDTLGLLDDCVEEQRIPEEHLRGILYVLESLQVIALGLSDNPKYMGTEDLRDYVKTLEKYYELEQSHLIGLHAIKFYFMWNLSNKSYEATRLVAQKLIDMDPENPEWYAILYLNHKFERQQGTQGRLTRLAAPSIRDSPSEIEIDILRKACSCPGAEKNVTVLTYNLMCLADVFRTKASQCRVDGIKELQYGELSFGSAEQVVDYLKQEAQKILELNDNTVRTLFIISRTFSSTLPFHYRDLELADSCISKAVGLYPNVSKVNHRKGILCFLKDNHDEGFTYLKKAYQLDPRNMNALIDAMYAAVPQSLNSEDEVNKLFEEARENSFVNEDFQFLSHVSFLTGVYMIAQGKSSEGVQKLIDSLEQFGDDTPFPHFICLVREMKRFGWRSKEEFRIGTIKKKLFESLRGEMADLEDGDKKTKLEKILELLKASQPPSQHQGPRDGDDRRQYRPRQRDDNTEEGRENRNRNDRANDGENARPYRPNDRRNENQQGRPQNGANGNSWRHQNGNNNGDRQPGNDRRVDGYNADNRRDQDRGNWRDKSSNKSTDVGGFAARGNDGQDRNGRGQYQNGRNDFPRDQTRRDGQTNGFCKVPNDYSQQLKVCEDKLGSDAISLKE